MTLLKIKMRCCVPGCGGVPALGSTLESLSSPLFSKRSPTTKYMACSIAVSTRHRHWTGSLSLRSTFQCQWLLWTLNHQISIWISKQASTWIHPFHSRIFTGQRISPGIRGNSSKLAVEVVSNRLTLFVALVLGWPGHTYGHKHKIRY